MLTEHSVQVDWSKCWSSKCLWFERVKCFMSMKKILSSKWILHQMKGFCLFCWWSHLFEMQPRAEEKPNLNSNNHRLLRLTFEYIVKFQLLMNLFSFNEIVGISRRKQFTVEHKLTYCWTSKNIENHRWILKIRP